MSPINVWGPSTWKLFHVIIENVKEEHFHNIYKDLFFFIKQICLYLPCPECSVDATLFWNNINLSHLKTKEDMKRVLYIFHNHVNKKTRKSLYSFSNMNQYKQYNIVNVFNHFITVYNTNGNMKLMADSLQRKLLVNKLSIWIKKNHIYYNIPR